MLLEVVGLLEVSVKQTSGSLTVSSFVAVALLGLSVKKLGA